MTDALIFGEGLAGEQLGRGQVCFRVPRDPVGGLDGTSGATHGQDDRRSDARIHRDRERLVSSQERRGVAALHVRLEGKSRRVLPGIHR